MLKKTIWTALALALVPLADAVANPAQLTVKKVAPDATTPFTFMLNGPTCADFPNQVSFTLVGGQSKVFNLCRANNAADTPQKEGRYVLTEVPQVGWTMPQISCTGHDTDPSDAFIIEPPSAFIEFSLGERKACTFTNTKAPTPPTPPPPATTPPPTVPVTQPQAGPKPKPKPHRCPSGTFRRHIVIKHGPNKGKHVSICQRRRSVPAAPNFTG